jgi:hypothetical protein
MMTLPTSLTARAREPPNEGSAGARTQDRFIEDLCARSAASRVMLHNRGKVVASIISAADHSPFDRASGPPRQSRAQAIPTQSALF